jgi:hypothetical protein
MTQDQNSGRKILLLILSSSAELDANCKAARTIPFKIPADRRAEFVMTAGSCDFIEPQARTRFSQVANSPGREQFVNQFLRNATLNWLVDDMVDAEWRGANGEATRPTSLATFQKWKILQHLSVSIRLIHLERNQDTMALVQPAINTDSPVRRLMCPDDPFDSGNIGEYWEDLPG